MKYLKYIIFVFLISCMPTKKTYLCNGIECKNNKEMKRNFEKTLSMEVFVKKDSNETIDLVELNDNKTGKKINNKKLFFKDLYNPLQDFKKNNVKKSVKNKQKKKVRKNNQPKIVKKNVNLVSKIKKKLKSNKSKKIDKKNTSKIVERVPGCKDLNNCNESQILEYFNKKANNKDYPDITSN